MGVSHTLHYSLLHDNGLYIVAQAQRKLNVGPRVTLQFSFFQGQIFPFVSYEMIIATRWQLGC